MEVGKKISLLRKNKGMTQKELADILHVTDKAISRWESGIGNPDLNSLPKIAKIFDVTVDYLLSDSNELPENKKSEVVETKKPKRSKKKLFLFGGIGIVALVIVLGCSIGIPFAVKNQNNKDLYARGINCMESGQYEDAKNIFDNLDYSDSKNKAIVCNGLITLDEAKNTKNASTLALGVQFIVTGGTDVNVHYDGNGKYIIDDQIRYDAVLTKEDFAFLVPSSDGFEKWINKSFYYYKQTTFLYLSAIWR